ncbi:MAG: deoxyguanosinetriphosphate triphosphohydrolase [Thermoanaerobacterales bacterium]|nr:deoxyguanosinetriphosphate triphosphohydrolase [Thermoanaerobacterales bacterium]
MLTPRAYREWTEELEERNLSPYACWSRASRGRELPEEPCPVRTAFQRDRDRIIHSKSFRRLKHKTQVFIIPEGDHYRTRLTHTLEVAQIARTMARALRLNEDLTEAVALGHDLGHTPFGHTGEAALDAIHPGGFRHNEQSLRVVEILEGEKGLNLTWEVRDGIANHTGPRLPATLEGQVVRYADRIAYINHDIDDALRGGVLVQADLPSDCLAVLGTTHRERINTMITDLIEASWDRPRVAMSPRVWGAMDALRDFLFERVYISSEAKREEGKARHVVRSLYRYFEAHLDTVPREYRQKAGEAEACRAVCDYIAGMTDRFAVLVFERLFIPRGFPVSP